MDEYAVLIERLVCLRDYEIILDIGSHILDLVKHTSRGLVDLSERCLDEAIFIYAREGRKI